MIYLTDVKSRKIQSMTIRKINIPSFTYHLMIFRKDSSLGYVYRLAHESERMLYATLHGDTETMNEILEYVHNTEVPLLSYNHETELSAIVNLIYLAARDFYRIEREEKA